MGDANRFLHRLCGVTLLSAGVLLGAGAFGARAAPTEPPETEGVDAPPVEVAEPAAQPDPGAATAPATPAPRPPASRPARDGTLMATVVLEGGRSFAMLTQGNGYRTVREGEEVGDGSRLREVRPDRIIVEQGGGTREILLFPVGLPPGVPDSRGSLSNPPGSRGLPGRAPPIGVETLPNRPEGIIRHSVLPQRRWRPGGAEGASPGGEGGD